MPGNKLPRFLKSEELKLIIFGGKGGSGKTTSAAATALSLAKKTPERKILVVSTDPAHSLGDSFNCKIGGEITSITSTSNLWALEMDALKLMEEFRQKNNSVIRKIADRGTYFDKEDIASFMDLSLPGMDEVMAVIEIANILKEERYDLIILDTAPTGHTLRLLALPEQMEKWIEVMDMMMQKHRLIFSTFTGRYKKDECDFFLEKQASDIKRVKSLLKNEETTEFVPVTIPEEMSIEETERLVSTLEKHNIYVENIIVNRIAEEKECKFCRAKYKDQNSFLKEINDKFGSYNLIKIPLFPYEIRGEERLLECAEILAGGETKYEILKKPKEKARPSSLLRGSLSNLLQKNLKFIMVGGKGGVGKTSIASAIALELANKNPNKKILAFSTDPAHGLSDSYVQPIGDKLTPISGVKNLWALELNATRLMEDFKKEYRTEIEKLFADFMTEGIDIEFDREIMQELISLAPPGVDELMALKKIKDFEETKEFDMYVFDNAATGHLIRLLELPELVRDWLKATFRLLLKYKTIVSVGKLHKELLDLSKGIKRFQEILTDSERCSLLTVTIAEAMGLLEMERLLSTIKKLKIPHHHIIVNMVMPSTGCSFCEFKRENQQKYIKGLADKFSEYDLIEVPFFPQQIRGLTELTKLAKALTT